MKCFLIALGEFVYLDHTPSVKEEIAFLLQTISNIEWGPPIKKIGAHTEWKQIAYSFTFNKTYVLDFGVGEQTSFVMNMVRIEEEEQEETAKIESFLTSRHPGVREITKSFLKGRP